MPQPFLDFGDVGLVLKSVGGGGSPERVGCKKPSGAVVLELRYRVARLAQVIPVDMIQVSRRYRER